MMSFRKKSSETAAWSYYVSLYMWVFMLLLKDRVTMDTEEVLGAGYCQWQSSSALLIYHRLRGIRNE
jgi:hypothetical protein